MLSNVTYQRLAGTSVLKDFVEFPSQLFEHWLLTNQVLEKHAKHYQTNETIPIDLFERFTNARKYGQGFLTIEYTASALLDQSLHCATITPINNNDNTELLTDITIFENNELNKLGMPDGMIMRHRPAHFQHLFSSSSHAARYYVYLWADVLVADGFNAFVETNDIFNPEIALKLKKYIYSSGNSMDPKEAYRLFRGR